MAEKLPAQTSLARVLGPATAFLIGLGVAIGSGILRTPGNVARTLGSPGWILVAWCFGGLFILASSFVSAELATRFPRAGGEYVYLREAYGEFVAFFFGWAYSIFIIGCGAAIIAVALGEAMVGIFGLKAGAAGPIGALAIAAVVGINIAGLRAGASLQNGMTVLKIMLILGIAVVAFAFGERTPDFGRALTPATLGQSPWIAFLAALPDVLWSYEGSTDSVKMAEEIEDVQRNLPRALIASALSLTVLYLLVNLAFMMVLSPSEMGASKFVANDVMLEVVGVSGELIIGIVSVIILFGCLSSTLLATVRVTFALARDGLAPRALASLSGGQAPVGALLAMGGIAATFALARDFTQILGIYFLAAAVLFGLNYASLLVFRYRERNGVRPAGIFRARLGPLFAISLILIQLAMAGHIAFVDVKTSLAKDQIPDSVLTALLLLACAGGYWLWRRSSPVSGSDA